MAGGVIKIPYVAHEAQSVGDIGRVADYKRAADFMPAGGGDNGLLALAKGLGALGEVIAKQREEAADLEMLQDFNALRLASQKEYDDFTQNSKGENAAGAYEYGAQRFGEKLSALDGKYGDDLRWLRFREQHVNPFGINLVGAYGDYGAKQHEAYKDSVVKGFLADGDRVIADPNAPLPAKLAAMGQQRGVLLGYSQSRGLDPGAAQWEAEKGWLTALAKGAADQVAALTESDPGQAGELLAGAMGRGAGAVGSLSAKYESRSAGSRAIGYDVKGGTSYGTYQIASKPGTFNRWLDWLKANGHEDVAAELSAGPANSGGRGGTVPQAWQKLVAEGRITQEMEHAFIKTSHFDPAMKGLKPELREMAEGSKTLQDVVWSTAVQHGAGGAQGILNNAYKKGMTPEQFVEAVYDGRTANFRGNPYAAQAANRFKDEGGEALARLREEKTGAFRAASEALAKDDQAGLYAALFTPGELAEMGKKAEVAAATKKADAVYLGLLDAPDGLSSDEAVAQAAETFTSIKDREAREAAISLFKRDCAAVSLRRDAADQVAKTKFIGLAASNAWPPSEQLKQVDALEGMTAAGKAKLRKELGEGAANKPTPENRAALGDLRARIDVGEIADDSEIEAFAFENGLSVAQINAARKYLEDGGQKGLLKQSDLNSVFKSLFPDKKKASDVPADLFDQVLAELEPGKKPNREVLRKIIANLYMDGESMSSGWFWDKDETYQTAKNAGRAESWLPDVTPEEESEIRAELKNKFGPQKITQEDVRITKRGKMGLSPWVDPDPPKTEEEKSRERAAMKLVRS